jgi:hypothetical protein
MLLLYKKKFIFVFEKNDRIIEKLGQSCLYHSYIYIYIVVNIPKSIKTY